MSDVNRRTVLGLTAALSAGAAASAGAAPLSPLMPGDEAPPESGKLPRFRYALSQGKPEVFPGGEARIQTIEELPISKRFGSALFRMNPGAIREYHWHDCAEWALILEGLMRTTIIHPDGAAETNDFGPGDVWYFPPGHGHMLQNIGPGDARFVLAFDDGNFNQVATFSGPAFLSKVPRSVLSKSLGVPEADLAGMVEGRNYLGQGRPAPQTPDPFRKGASRRPAHTNKYAFLSSEPTHKSAGVTEWRVTVREFPISKRICATVLELAPGSLRELHWHPISDEWQFVIGGTVRVGAVGPGPHTPSGVEELATGDVGYVPRNYGHYIENVGPGPARVLLVFDTGEYQAVDVSDWLANNPAAVVADVFHLPDAVVAKLPKRDLFVTPDAAEGR